MPPRKSGASVVTIGDSDAAGPKDSHRQRDGLSVEDLNMPRTIVGRLAKGVLPPNTQIQKDALLAISKSLTVFINFLASNAAENAQAAGKKTIMPHDVLAALKDQEFEAFVPRVQAEVAKYNEIQCDKRNAYRRTKKAESKAGTGDGDSEMTGEPTTDVNGTAEDVVEGPPSKKARREPGDVGAEDDEDVEIEDEDVAEEEDSADDEAEDDVEEDEVVEEVEDDPDADEDEETGEHGGGVLNGIRDEALDEPDSD